MAATPSITSGRIRSADLELDLQRHLIKRDGRDIKLSKLTYRTLQVLTSSAPAVVTKDDLAERVWSGRTVSPETVAQRVKLLRQAS